MATFIDSLFSGTEKKKQEVGNLILQILGLSQQKTQPFVNFYRQTNEQRQQEVNQFVDKLVPQTKLTPILKPVAKTIGGLLVANQITEEDLKNPQTAMNLAINISGGMENRAIGRTLTPLANEAKNILQKSNPRGLMGESFAQTAFRREVQLAPGEVYDQAAQFAKDMEQKAASKFKFPHPFSPEQADVVSGWGRDVKTKANLLDYFRTPENVLNKVGLGGEAKQIRAGWEAYKKELPAEINRITEWMKKVPSPDSSKRIFNYLDGKAVDLTPPEQEVAGQIKNYLKGWADRLKLPEDKRVSEYITHIFEKGKTGTEFDPEIARLIDEKVPESVYDPFLQQRQGMPNYKQDVWQALDAYVKRATRKVNMDEPLNFLSQKANNLDPETYKYVQRYASRINLRPTEFDNLVDNLIKSSPVGYRATARPTAYLTGKFRQQVYRGALGLNISSAIRNLTQGVNTYAKLGEKYTILGYTDLVKRMATGGLDELYKTGVLDDAILQDRSPSVYKGILKKADEGLLKLFDTAELINRGAAYFGAKKQALSKGLSESEAIDTAKALVRQTQFAFGSIDTPVAMSSDIAKTLLQFKTFDIKQLEFLAGMAKNKEWGGLLRYVGASLAMTATVGKLLGFDIKNFAPFSSGRFNSPAGELAGSAWQMLSTNEARREQGKKNLMKSATLLIPAGVQAKKSIEGYQAYQEGGSKTPTGRERFDIPQTPGNLLKSVLFGQYSLPQAQEYFSNLDQGVSKSEAAYAKWKKLNAEDPKKAQEFGRTLTPSIQSEMRGLLRDDEMGITKQEKDWKKMTVEKRADEIAKVLKKFPKGTQERADKVQRWKSMGIISDDVYKQLLLLQRDGKL